MVASYVRERERTLCWLENVERLVGLHVDGEAAYKAWGDGYTVREFAALSRHAPLGSALMTVLTLRRVR
jgi:hypothetical protein